MVGESVGVMSATDTVMDGDGKLGSDTEPKATGRSSVGRVTETVREEFLDSGEGLESDSTLGGLGEVRELEGVGYIDGVRVGGVLNGGEYHFAIRNGDSFFRDGWDVGIHC